MQAQCPSCGSSIPFKSELSAYAVCSACQTLVARTTVSVEEVGKVAVLQSDGSLLRVGTQGVYKGKSFEIIGRIQVALGPVNRPDVLWNEWHAAFSDGLSGWIGESQGQYFVSFGGTAKGAPPHGDLQLGKNLSIEGVKYVVASISDGTALGFEGELPFVMSTEYQATFVDLMSAKGLSATLDYSDNPPLLFQGEWCTFDQLKFSGLRVADAEGEGPRLAAANLRSLKCPSCGAPHELHAGGLSQTMVCGFCDTSMDLDQDATFREVLKVQQAQAKVPAVIPLGTEGKLPGLPRPIRCIGYMRRFCVVEGVRYHWSEYLLYEPTLGYRWLTESKGHWTLLEPLHKVPTHVYGDTPVGYPQSTDCVLDGVTYKHFQRTRANVDYVAGEFPWRVRVGESSMVDDYVAPPLLLSADITPTEINWSQGVYLTGEEIWRAFGLSGPLLNTHGVANNQPNPHRAAVRRRWTAYAAALAACFCFLLLRASRQPPAFFQEQWIYKRSEPEHSKLANVTIPEGVHNVRLTVSSSRLDKRWAFFQLSLIDEARHQAFDTGVTLYHDAGVEDGEGWSESRLLDSAMLSQVPGGTYLLRVDPQSNLAQYTNPETPAPGAPETNPLLESPLFSFTVKAERDIPQWGYFWLLLLLGCIPPLWSLWRSSAFETARWSESDHASSLSEDE